MVWLNKQTALVETRMHIQIALSRACFVIVIRLSGQTFDMKVPLSPAVLYPKAQSARPVTRNLLFGINLLCISIDIEDSGNSLTRFIGSAAGMSTTAFLGVEGLVALASLTSILYVVSADWYLRRRYFRR